MDSFDKNLALADRRIISLFTDKNPWWLWSVVGDRVFMANLAATREMGALGRAIVSERLFSPRHPFVALIIEELKKFTGSAHFFTLRLKNDQTIDYVLTKLTLENGSEAMLLRSVEPKADIDAFYTMVDVISEPVLVFDASGAAHYTNVEAQNLSDIALPDLLGQEGNHALLKVASAGYARFNLATGTLHLTKLADLGLIFGAITPVMLPQEKELIFIDEVPLSIENDDFIIEGTMPAPFSPSIFNDELFFQTKKATRFAYNLDQNLVFTAVSPELAEIIGHDKANIAGKNLGDLLKSLIKDPENSLLTSLKNQETKTGHSTLWTIQGDKQQVRIDLAALPVFDRVKGFNGYGGFGLVRDYISLEPVKKLSEENKLSEEEIKNFNTVGTVLKAAAPKPKKSTDKSPQVIYFGNKILQVNDLFLELSGFASLEAFEISGGTARLFAGHQLNTSARELSLTHKDGHDIPVSIRLTKTQFEGQSALKMSFQVLEVKAKPTQTFSVQNFAFPSLIIDEKGLITAVNHAFATSLASDEIALIGKSFAGIVAPESHTQAEDYIESLLQNGVRSVINEGREILFKAASGRVKPLFMRLSMMPQDQILAQFFDPQDIKQKDIKQPPIVDNKQIAELAHEIRTPLNAILGFSESMKEERFGAIMPQAYRGYVDDIHAAGTHMLSVINGISAQNTPLTFEVDDINTLIEESLTLMSNEAHLAKVIMRKALTRPMPQVLTDKRALKQILLNLLGNAVKYTPQGGQIIISSLLNEAGEAVIRVRDTGDGLESAGQHENSGTGLGLPIIKSLSEANRTRFSLTSKAGYGTLAEVVFPQERIL
jgi:PAS domain S-box-containing protein